VSFTLTEMLRNGSAGDRGAEVSSPRPTTGGSPSVPMPGEDLHLLGHRLAIATCVIGLLLSGLSAALSDGALHDDDLTHYLYAKWAKQIPAYFVHEWGRPGFTVLYFVPAQIGWLAARWFSGILSVLAAWLAYRTADRMRLPWAWLAAPLTLIQPLFFQLSYTTLTETALSFYLMLALWLLVNHRHGLSAFVFSLTLITRHEAVIWLPLWAWAMWHDRVKLRDCPWLAWAPIAHNLLTPWLLGRVPAGMFLAAKEDLQYGSGSLLAMSGRAVLACGPGILALACLGCVPLCRRRWGMMVASLAVSYFVAHSVVRFFGLYATGGYARFLAPISPLVAILAVAGLRALVDWSAVKAWIRPCVAALAFLFFWFAGEWEKPAWLYPPFLLTFRLVTFGVVLLAAGTSITHWRRHRLRWVRWLLPVCLIGITLIHTAYASRPWRLGAEQTAIENVVNWLKTHGYRDRRMFASNVWAHYFWGTALDPADYDTERELNKAPPGSVLIWEGRYGPNPPRTRTLYDYLSDAHYRLLTRSEVSGEPFCFAFEKL